MVSYEHLKKEIIGRHGPFNLVLSDGLHTPDAVENETSMLIAKELIQPGQEFAMVWDDCGNVVDNELAYNEIRDVVVKKNFPKLRSLFANQHVCTGRFVIPGWVGQNEFSHGTCVFTTLDISGPNLGASAAWMPQDSDV